MKSNVIIINNRYETIIKIENGREYILKPGGEKLFLDTLTITQLEQHEIHTLSIGTVKFEKGNN